MVKMVKVAWWEAVGREVAPCERIVSVKHVEGSEPFGVTSTGDVVDITDGMVEVVALEEAFTLSQREISVLAKVLIRDRIADCGAWAHWELVPLIDEESYLAVLQAINQAHAAEVYRAIDSGGNELMARVS